MSEDDTYELAEPDDEPTPSPPPPPKSRPPAAAASDPQPIELDEPAPERSAAKEKRPTIDPSAADAGPGSTTAAEEPMAVSPAKARQAREDQRRRAAQELAEADARKQKLILILAGTLIGALVLLWIWFKLF